MNEQQLEENEYPLKAPLTEADQWIMLPNVPDTSRPLIVAIDCEMVQNRERRRMKREKIIIPLSSFFFF
jgi:hypothetical protein